MKKQLQYNYNQMKNSVKQFEIGLPIFFVVLCLQKTLNLVVYMKGSRNCKYWLRKLINNSPKVFGRLILICLDFSYFYFRLRRCVKHISKQPEARPKLSARRIFNSLFVFEQQPKSF